LLKKHKAECHKFISAQSKSAKMAASGIRTLASTNRRGTQKSRSR